MPWPPPMHMVMTPRVMPSRRIECRMRVVSTAPVAPIAWPCAMAPPSTPQLLDAGEGDGRREHLVDLDALDIADRPNSPSQSLPHGQDWADAEHPCLHGAQGLGEQ